MSRGTFITFEGGEGSGKSTVLARLAKSLTEKGYSVISTREPGGVPLGEEIRSLLLNKSDVSIGSRAELLLFLAARSQHIEELIRPALAEGKIVLCDRFTDSTIAYQGFGRKEDLDEVMTLCHLATDGFKPNFTFLLDVDPEVGVRRSKRLNKENAKEGETDRIESEDLSFHKRVREGLLFLSQNESDRFVVVDSHQELDKVYADVESCVLESVGAFKG